MFFYFCGSYLFSWIRIRIVNSDPGTPMNPDPDPQRYLGRDENPDREHAATARV